MKRIAFGICAAVLCSLGATRASEGEFELTLSEGLSWQKVFEAGFRPVHKRDGRFGCEQRDVKLGVLLREGGPTMHLGRGDIEFSLVENHQIVLVVFYGRENRTVEEVRANADLFAQIFGEHVTWRSDFQFGNSNGNVDNRNAGMAAKVGDWSIGYGYSRTGDPKGPLVERISMAWKSDKARRAKRMKEKISPPTGYENVSDRPHVLRLYLQPIALRPMRSRTNDLPTRLRAWCGRTGRLISGSIGCLVMVAMTATAQESKSAPETAPDPFISRRGSHR